jgi:two-component system LytT family response regulator
MSKPIRVLIADDETSARRRLLQFLSQEPDVDVVAECRNGLEACTEIKRIKPDLVFLDVQMPELDGLQVVGQIGVEQMPATIFVTAYDQYAVPAFDANAMDYLLKPFDGERFGKAMSKARTWVRMGMAAECHNQLAAVRVDLGLDKKFQDRILVPSGESQLLIKVADILYISAEGNYIRLHMQGSSHLLRERMVGITQRLDPAIFRRIHRSHIVNLDHVSKRLPWYGGDCLIMMTDGSRLTLSRNFREALQEFD